MPIIIGIFCALPFLAGLIAEYLVCRLTRRRWWKLLPPAALVEAASPGGGRRADGCGGCGAGRSLGVRPVSADPTALCAGIAGAVCPAGPAGGLAAVETAVGPAGGEG